MITIPHDRLVGELVEFFSQQKFTVHGAKDLAGYDVPPAIRNDGFGDLRARVPDVIGVDGENQRIIFGVVRRSVEELDNEQSLTDYNVYLDHKHSAGSRASLLVVLLPPSLLTDFTAILTHYVHREYWHRILPVASKVMEREKE